jgi:PAS domain S-box-containing protein
MVDKNIHALLIEDDPDDVLLLKEALVEVGPSRLKLDCTDRLSRGLIQLGSQAYDVLLLDLNLPDSRGLDTLSTTVKRFPRLPVVVLSGLADDAITVEAVRRGAQDYLVKGEISGPLVLRVVRYAIERKQVEAVIRASETRYRTLVETSPNGITLADLEGKLLLCNRQAADLYGYNSPDSVLGNNFFKFVSPTDRQQAAHNIRKTLNEGKSTTGEYILLNREGKQFPAEISTAVQCNTSGAPVGFISIIRDVTERKKVINAEKQVVMLEKEFLSGVAQQLRAPLLSIMEYFIRAHSARMNNQVLQDGSLERASKDLASLLDMVNELLDFSLLESGQLAMDWAKVDLASLIGEVVANYREQAEAKRVTIFAAPSDALFAEVDAARMRRVLASLVKQAIGNSEKDSTVLVTGKAMNGKVLINVIDEGQGIPFEDSERIFEKYYQADDQTRQGGIGMSLGLYTARQIVEAHGGSLTLSSQVEGGNTFSITIPVERKKPTF